MKPKTVMILIALVINLGLLLASSPSRINASSERSSNIFFPCCKKTADDRPYCCQDCCFFRWNCLVDEHCAPRG